MTSRGKAFKEIARKVVIIHGFGSRKTVTEYRGSLTEACGCEFTGDDLDWLVDNGYLFHYKVERSRGRGRYGQYGRVHRTDDDYGVTAKGWAVANKYLAAE